MSEMIDIDYDKLKDIRILYVEDDENIRNALISFLEFDVKELYVAINGEEGIELFKKYSPDIIITDIQMPKMNGLKMARAIKEIDKNIPIIVTTAFSDMDYFMESIDIGIDKYITKPIDLEMLMESIYKSAIISLQTKKIKAQNLFIQAMLDKNPNFIFTLKNSKINYINKSFLNFLNLSSLDEFFADKINLYDYITSAETNKSVNYDYFKFILASNKKTLIYLKYPNLTQNIYLMSCNSFIDESSYLITLSDVTEIEREKKEVKDKLSNIEKEMLQKQKILEFQSRQAQMGQMISAIAHQWKQPLNVIAGSIATLSIKMDFGEVNEDEIKECIENTDKQIKFMSQTIEDFRSFFKPNKERAIFNIQNAIEKSENLISSMLQKINVKPIINGENFNIDGYENEFSQVLLNILSNAKDAILEKQNMDNNFIGKIEINLNPKDKSIEITDNAGGIAENIIDKIFDAYTSTKGEKGTGIGLNISKTIIENMNGKISVSNKNDGASFLISFDNKIKI